LPGSPQEEFQPWLKAVAAFALVLVLLPESGWTGLGQVVSAGSRSSGFGPGWVAGAGVKVVWCHRIYAVRRYALLPRWNGAGDGSVSGRAVPLDHSYTFPPFRSHCGRASDGYSSLHLIFFFHLFSLSVLSGSSHHLAVPFHLWIESLCPFVGLLLVGFVIFLSSNFTFFSPVRAPSFA
jgi:hypothetical protein